MSRVLYLCDRKKCEECKPYCTHTADIKHAVNFGYGQGLFIEKEQTNNKITWEHEVVSNYKVPIIPKLPMGKCSAENESDTN